MEQQKLPAGKFTDWLNTTKNTLHNNQGADVPCGSCTACCTSSYFIHIRPDEKETIARIPKELLFPAPGFPKGHKVMGFDEKGHCPMLKENKCTIYEDRPITCRTYDCRVFPVSGLTAGGKKKTLINQQARRWKFDFDKKEDLTTLKAIQTAARFLLQHRKEFPDDFVPSNPTQVAILAIKVYEVFLKTEANSSIPEIIKNIVRTVGYKKS